MLIVYPSGYKNVTQSLVLWHSETQTRDAILAQWEDQLDALDECVKRMHFRYISSLGRQMSEAENHFQKGTADILDSLASFEERMMVKFIDAGRPSPQLQELWESHMQDKCAAAALTGLFNLLQHMFEQLASSGNRQERLEHGKCRKSR